MATLGPGLIILAVIWIFCIVLCLVLARAQGPIAYAGLGAILVAIIVTLVLWLMPRGPEADSQYIVYDYTYIPRTILISICGILLLVGLVVAGIFHVFDQKRAMPLKHLSH